jgi:hypothetical protein
MSEVTLASGEVVDPPGRLNVDRLLGDVNALQLTLQRYRGYAVTGDVARAIAARANTYFDDGVDFGFMFETIHQYCTKVLDDEFIRLLALQLVSRRDELKKGPLTLFSCPIKAEWVALELAGISESRWRDKEPGATLKLFAFSGHPAGHRLTKKVPERWLNFLAYQVGFTRRRRYEGFQWTLIGTRFWGYLVPDEKADILNFSAWFVTPAFLKMNREIIAFRTRHNQNTGVDKPECPHGHDWDCDQCPQKENACPGSIHRIWQT